MSERHYGDCHLCYGEGKRRDPVLLVERDCMLCGGTGFEGSPDMGVRAPRRVRVESNRITRKELIDLAVRVVEGVKA